LDHWQRALRVFHPNVMRLGYLRSPGAKKHVVTHQMILMWEGLATPFGLAYRSQNHHAVQSQEAN